MRHEAYNESIILELLKKKGKINTDDARDILKISESSTRRLFRNMEDRGSVHRVYGGIILAKENEIGEDAFPAQAGTEKQVRIARAAGEMIADNETVFLSGGEIMRQLAVSLKERIAAKKLSGIHVVTNSLSNMQILNDSCMVMLMGGQYSGGDGIFLGYAAERFARLFKYSKAFFEADGFTPDDGFMTDSEDKARLYGVIIGSSQSSCVLAESDVIFRTAFIPYDTSREIRCLITDTGVSDETLRKCGGAGLDLITV